MHADLDGFERAETDICNQFGRSAARKINQCLVLVERRLLTNQRQNLLIALHALLVVVEISVHVESIALVQRLLPLLPLALALEEIAAVELISATVEIHANVQTRRAPRLTRLFHIMSNHHDMSYP